MAAGQVSFSTLGIALNITNSPGAIINWQGFSIGAGETTRFIQQSAASSVLNRVIGPDPSVIFGTLTSNGRVFLINPSGILFGQGARIDVAGLAASTLNLNNQDFLANRLNFASNPLAGKVENQGSIITPSGGSVYLVGANVSNSGIINSPQGDVILAAGQSVKIFDTSTPGVRVEITAGNNAAVNLGEILARSGQVGIYGAALRNTGIIDADQVQRDASGKIVLRAKQDVTLAAGSRLSASGEQGGEITVQSETGTTLVSGTIEAKGTGAVAGAGGTVQLLGNRVGLVAANIDASGPAGGGTVLVGGDYQGTGSAQQATATYMSSDSTINADAINSGNGGKVILWSDGFTNVHGTIMARGGTQSGDGGFIETSGHQILDAAGVRGSAGAPNGKGGLWLFDPDSNILINGSVTTTVTGAPNFSPTANTTNILNTDIRDLLNGGTDVTVITTNNVGGAHPSDGTQVGDITVALGITTTAGGARTLTLNSGSGGGLNGVGGSVTVDATLSATGVGNSLAVNLINTTASGGVFFTGNGNITTAGGNILVQANTGGVTQNAASTLNSGAGTITLTSPVGITLGGALTSSNGTGNAIVVKAGNGTAAGTATGGDITITTGTIGLNGGGGAVLYTGNLSSTGVVAAAGGSGSGRFRYNSSPTTQNYSLALNPAAVSAVFREAVTPLTVTANNASKTYGASDPAQSFASVTGYINGDSAGLTGAYARTAGETVAGGPYVITVGTLASDVGYGITFTGGKTLTIGKAHLTATADNQSRLYGDANPALTATLSGFKNGEILSTSGVTGSAAVTTTATASTAVGSVAITDSVGTLLAGNYDFTAFNPGTLTIGKAHLTVTADNQSRLYGDANPALTATLSGFKNSQDLSTSGVTGSAAVTTTATVSTAVGSVAITDSVGTLLAGNYDFTTFNPGALTIGKAHLTVAVDNQSRLYGDANPSLTATLSGFKNSELLSTSGVTGSAAVTTTATVSTAVGSVAITDSVGTLLAGNYDFTTFNPGTLSIGKAHLTVTADNQSRLYGDTNPALTATLSGFKNSETLASSGVTGSAAVTTTATASTAVGAAAITDTIGTLTASNYDFTTFTPGTLTIGKAHLTVAADNQSRLYGDTNPALTATLSGFKNSQDLSTSGVTGSAAVTTAATASTAVGSVAITDSVGTLLAGNYDFTAFNPGTLTISKAPLTVTANSISKTYDGFAYSGVIGVDYSSFKNSETAAVLGGTLVYGGTWQGAINTGTYIITPGGLTSSNYAISFVDGTLGIIPAGLHAISLNGTRAYNGTVDVAASIFTLSGLVSGENLTLTGIGTIANPSVGANKPVTLGSLALGDGTNGLASNYTFTGGTQTASITAIPLSVTANPVSKTYNGLAYNGGNGVTYSGFVNSETVTVLGGTLTYDGTSQAAVNVGSYLITPGGLTSGNYTLSYSDGALTVNKAALSAAIIGAPVKVYDGTLASTLAATNYSLSGFMSGEGATLNQSVGIYNSKDVASATSVSATLAAGNYTATGTTLLGNYTLATTASGPGSITRAALSVTANPASKTYDGLAYSGGNGVAYSGFKNGETISVFGGTLVYGGSAQGAINAGSYHITPAGWTSSNYDISFVDGTLSVIPAGLHAISLDGTRAYNGTVNVAANIFTLSGLVSGEHLTLTGIGTVADTNVGANKPVTLGSLTLGNGTNGLASNYTFAGGTQTASITRAPLSVTANSASKTYDGVAYSGGNGVTYNGFVNSEGTGILGGTLTYGGNAQGAINAGSYLITPSGWTSGNYSISFINGILSVNPAPLAVASLSVAANAAVKTYDGLAYRGGNGVTYTGFRGNDTAASLTGTLSYSGDSQGAVNVGYYTIIPFGQSSSNYTITYVNGRLSLIPAALGIAANSATRLYGEANPAFGATYTGLQNGETAAVLTGALAFATPAIASSHVGNYAIVPSGQSSTNYTISYVNGTLGVIPAALGIAANSTSKTYGSTVSFNGSEFSSTGLKNGETVGSVILASAGAVSTAGVADSLYDITVSAASGGTFKPGNYNISYVDGSLGVIPVGLLGIAANAAVKTYDGLAYRGGNGVTYTGFQGTDTAASLTGTLSYGGNSQGAVNVGNYAIIPSGQISSNYTITYVNGRLSVTPAPLGIAANSATRLYGDANPGFSATYTGFKNAETAAALTGSLAFATPAIATSNVGNYAIVPSGQGSTNYTITYVNGSLGVTPAPLGIAANSTSKTYGSTVNFNGSEFSSTGLKNGETVGSVSLASAGATATAGVAGSPYDIRPSSASGGGFNPGNYAISYVAGALGVIPAPLVIAANSATRLFGDANPEFSAIYTGFKNGETDAVLTGALSLTTPAILTSGIGNYPISPSGQSSMNYNIAYVDGTLGVTLGFNAEQVIYAGEVNNKFYYRPSSFWHIALSSDNADPGFDVMRGTEDSDSRSSRRMNSCDSASGGGFCETWSFPQQLRKGVKK